MMNAIRFFMNENFILVLNLISEPTSEYCASTCFRTQVLTDLSFFVDFYFKN